MVVLKDAAAGEGTFGATAVPQAPDARFASAAAASLAPVARDLESVDQRVRSGELVLDVDAAHRLLATLNDIKSRVHDLIANSDRTIDQVLKFGDNFVGETMSRRLRSAASGGGSAAIPVLQEFANQLEALESTVRRAAGMIVATDTEAQDTFQRLGGTE